MSQTPDRNLRVFLMFLTICISVVIFILSARGWRILRDAREYFERAVPNGIELDAYDLIAVTGALVAVAGFASLISLASSVVVCAGSAGFISAFMFLLTAVAMLGALAVAIALTVIITTHHPYINASPLINPGLIYRLISTSPITADYTEINVVTAYTLMSWFLWIILIISFGFEAKALHGANQMKGMQTGSKRSVVVPAHQGLGGHAV
ncbi:uncharacterized protein MELLADRAFT_108541 [Melampsora larici-populina 98AG31]|uniref:Uncharacterized protein n=1 Tax=Melampsora larici-populina (strain 98AG31 / pathotype 3-4-7) TaxID=747676 RepID=F4RTF1_MELLP|nr:uncharacterized protein MELLADRAFT_108541 [Melampsora larici-populina 98AG31]EGG04350.1 hypothetical protein MELLADRAFT_108541 [Melampsora larici-populina 98AG31]